jgi:hypothetical protein
VYIYIYLNQSLILKTEFGLRIKLLNSWNFTCQVYPLAPIHLIKKHDEGQRNKFYYAAWNMPWEEAK